MIIYIPDIVASIKVGTTNNLEYSAFYLLILHHIQEATTMRVKPHSDGIKPINLRIIEF